MHTANRARVWSSLFLVTLGLSGCASPPDLYRDKQALIRYHDSGRYEAEIERVVAQATRYIQKRAASGETNLAVVLDIDETALSTWQRLIQDDFARKDEMFVKWVQSHSDPAIGPILDLYHECKRRGLKVFFITGRRTFLTERTEETLKTAGYTDYDGIFFREATNKDKSLATFKASVRKKLTESGLRIIANIGDQQSDLAGGFAERTFKLPNPFYYTP